jgi:hypothetical protein
MFTNPTFTGAVAITSGTITGITDLAVADGGTGASSITANSVVLGNGTSALSGNLVAPSTSGNVLTSNGTTWTSAAAPTGITATSGSAPYYGARAWVNFDGANGSIRASQNVSNVTKNATGEYTITFATAMPDANYAVATNAGTGSTGTGGQSAVVSIGTQTSSSIRIMVTASTTGGGYDKSIVCVTIFR